MTASSARSLRHESATATGVSRPSTTRAVRRSRASMTSGVSRAPRPTRDGGDALEQPEDAGEARWRARSGAMRVKPPTSIRALPAPTIASMTIADAADGNEADDDERRSPQGGTEPEPGRQPLGSHEEGRRGGREDRPGAEGCVEHPTPGSPSPTSSTATTTVKTVMAPRMKVWAPIRAKSSRRSRMAVHRADPAQGAVQRAFGVGLGVVERRRFRVDAGHQPAGPRRGDRRHGEHLGRAARSEQHGAEGGAGQGRRRVQGPADDVGTRELRRRVAQRGQEGGVHRPEEHGSGRRHASPGRTPSGRARRRTRPTPARAMETDRTTRDGHEHLLPWPPVGVLGRQGGHDGRREHPDERHETHLGGAAAAVGVDRERRR